jgi:hypothetical protein
VKKERAQGLWDNEEVDTPGVKTMEGEVEGVADVEEIIKRGYYGIQGLRCDVETSIIHIPTSLQVFGNVRRDGCTRVRGQIQPHRQKEEVNALPHGLSEMRISHS